MPVLLLPCGPAAVLRRVWSVIVDAVYRQFIGVAVGQRPIAELREVSPPRSAHGNSAPAIVFPIRAVGIAASLTHVLPDAVEASVPVAHRVAMFDVGSPQASAGLIAASDQSITGDFSFGSAIAAAHPVNDVLCGPTVSSMENRPEAKTLVCDIGNRSGHGAPPYRSLGQVTGRRANVGPLRILAGAS